MSAAPEAAQPMAPTLRAGADGLSERDLAAVVGALRAGRAIIYPTETFYGLGARALDERAVEHVQAIKGRPDGKPFPVLVSDLEMLGRVAAKVPRVAERLIERYWPGALTVVLPARPGLPARVVGAGGTIACRVSSSPIATQLVRALGEPLVATSANVSGGPSARTAAEAARQVGRAVAFTVDGGVLPGQLGSTIVDGTVDPPRIVRAGDLDVDLAGGCSSPPPRPE